MPRFDRPVAPDPYSLLPAVPAFTVTSDDLTEGAAMPDAQAYASGNHSPHLAWSGAPEGTRSYAVTCFDPDAPTGCGWWHWVVAGLPADTTSLATNAGAKGSHLPAGAFHVRNDFGDAFYGGAAAPAGDRAHRYIFAVHALDVAKPGFDATAGAATASFVTVQHAIARATLAVTWQHPG